VATVAAMVAEAAVTVAAMAVEAAATAAAGFGGAVAVAVEAVQAATGAGAAAFGSGATIDIARVAPMSGGDPDSVVGPPKQEGAAIPGRLCSLAQFAEPLS